MKKRLVALGMAFLMAMSTCMTAFAGYWYLEDGRWEYRDDSGARVRNTLKKSGSHYWWLGPDGYLRTGHAGEDVYKRQCDDRVRDKVLLRGKAHLQAGGVQKKIRVLFLKG